MSTVNPTMVSEYAQRDGFDAARLMRPVQSVEEYLRSHPEIANGDSDDQNLYRTTFKARYAQTVNEMGGAGITYQGKSPAQVATELEAAEAKKKTVEEWEGESSIPNWSVAKAVASNFNADVQVFHQRVSSQLAIASLPGGAEWSTKYASFYAQWKTLYAAIQMQATYTPSSAVAEVRKARVALGALQSQFEKIAASGQKTSVVTPTTDTQVKPPTPIGAKAKIPTWGIVAALAAIAGGALYMFNRKKKASPALLPPPKGMPLGMMMPRPAGGGKVR